MGRALRAASGKYQADTRSVRELIGLSRQRKQQNDCREVASPHQELLNSSKKR
jgi:hypothetical protein